MKYPLLLMAGAAHFGILIASGLTPKVLNWRGELAGLPLLLRQLFWVYGAFIVLTIASFGTLTLLYAGEMAAGAPVARGLCAFIAIFWLARLSLQFCLFDVRAYLTNPWLKWGERLLTLGFAFFALVYGWAALLPGEVRL